MVAENETGVVITNKDIYTELLKVKEAVTAMSPQAAQITDHEARLRSLEKWKYGLPASIGLAIAAILDVIFGGKH